MTARRQVRRTGRVTGPGPRVPAPAVAACSFLAGSIPFSGIAARLVAGVDLRQVGSGTVSGTALYEVAGFPWLAAAGVFEVGKGVVGPMLAGSDRPWLGAAAAACTICGHDWSPFLGGAGGRGISPALGSLAVLAPEGAALLAGGLAIGRLARQTGVASLAALAALAPVLAARRGPVGLAVAAAVGVPMIAKRLAGNRFPPPGRLGPALAHRLLFDCDPGERGARGGVGRQARRVAKVATQGPPALWAMAGTGRLGGRRRHAPSRPRAGPQRRMQPRAPGPGGGTVRSLVLGGPYGRRRHPNA